MLVEVLLRSPPAGTAACSLWQTASTRTFHMASPEFNSLQLLHVGSRHYFLWTELEVITSVL